MQLPEHDYAPPPENVQRQATPLCMAVKRVADRYARNAVAVAAKGLTAGQPWEDYAPMFVLATASALIYVFVSVSRSCCCIRDGPHILIRQC